MGKTIIIIMSAIVSIWTSAPEGKSLISEATLSDCENIQRNFTRRSRFITWDNDTTSGQIDSSFYNRYLLNLEEFKDRGHQRLYYHSVPDIQTDMCLIIVKCVTKDEQNPLTQFQNQYSCYLVDLTEKPKVVLELAGFEESLNTQRRVYSNFIDNKTLVQTRIREYILDYDTADNTFKIESDSSVFPYAIERQRFKSLVGHGVVSIKKGVSQWHSR